jgi:hypothetical protein
MSWLMPKEFNEYVITCPSCGKRMLISVPSALPGVIADIERNACLKELTKIFMKHIVDDHKELLGLHMHDVGMMHPSDLLQNRLSNEWCKAIDVL